MRSATDGKSISDLVWCRRGCLNATRSTSGADYYAAAYSVDSWLEILYPYAPHSSPFIFFRSASWTHPVMFHNLELIFNWTASRRNGYRPIEVRWLNARWQKYSGYCEMQVFFQMAKYHFIYCLLLCKDRDPVLIYRGLHIAGIMSLKPSNLCNIIIRGGCS